MTSNCSPEQQSAKQLMFQLLNKIFALRTLYRLTVQEKKLFGETEVGIYLDLQWQDFYYKHGNFTSSCLR